MADIKPFNPVKLICGLLASQKDIFTQTRRCLEDEFGLVDHSSPLYEFTYTDYYEKQMGIGLKRQFLSFSDLINPEQLSHIKIRTNELEEVIRIKSKARQRIINIDPGYMSASALTMATVKDFSHRIPLQNGIYAHLELQFLKNGIKTLSWTYPDFKTEIYHSLFLDVRKTYLAQLRQS
ncbi:DUF4416 family protein [Acidobacteriota bacterium]